MSVLTKSKILSCGDFYPDYYLFFTAFKNRRQKFLQRHFFKNDPVLKCQQGENEFIPVKQFFVSEVSVKPIVNNLKIWFGVL
jgi:hypothetical protein